MLHQGAFTACRPLVLASASPRRRELLQELGLTFSIQTVADAEPAFTADDDPALYAMRAAQAKAEAVAKQGYAPTLCNAAGCSEDATATLPVILGADTIVVLHEAGGAVILGKPTSTEEALAMLLNLSGREHTVYTGCALIWPLDPPSTPSTIDAPLATTTRSEQQPSYRVETFYDAASVTFAAWPEAVLRAYVATGESMDKAGAYAIQGKGAFLVRSIQGLWSTIVGLPVTLVAERLLAGGALGIGHPSQKLECQ